MKFCIECNSPATEDHHVIPESLGGTATVPLCGECHSKAHDHLGNRRDQHSNLTKIGIVRAKEKGVVLGNLKNLPQAQKLGRDMLRKKADDFALTIYPILEIMLKSKMTYKEMADKLNTEGQPTARSDTDPQSVWHPSTISNVLKRCRDLKYID